MYDPCKVHCTRTEQETIIHVMPMPSYGIKLVDIGTQIKMINVDNNETSFVFWLS